MAKNTPVQILQVIKTLVYMSALLKYEEYCFENLIPFLSSFLDKI